MPQPRRTPTPVRIAAWRRRILVGSLGLFVAAWLAVVGLGKQASSAPAAAKPTTTAAQSQDQSSQTYDPYASGSSDDDSGYADGSSSSDSGSSQSDMSGATTSQS
jgi:hypothetical protein